MKEINKIKSIFMELFGLQPHSVTRIDDGEFNTVYKVECLEKTYVIKVFRLSIWPEPGKLEWLSTKLAEFSGLSPKLTHISRNTNYFAAGFAIFEYLEGIRGYNIFKSHNISECKHFFKELGKTLRRVHSVSLDHFGSINNSSVSSSRVFKEFALRRLSHKLVKLTRCTNQEFGSNVANTIINDLLSDVHVRVIPCLVHGDVQLSNCVWKDDKTVALVDWDNSSSSCWVKDYGYFVWIWKHQIHNSWNYCISQIIPIREISRVNRIL